MILKDAQYAENRSDAGNLRFGPKLRVAQGPRALAVARVLEPCNRRIAPYSSNLVFGLCEAFRTPITLHTRHRHPMTPPKDEDLQPHVPSCVCNYSLAEPTVSALKPTTTAKLFKSRFWRIWQAQHLNCAPNAPQRIHIFVVLPFPRLHCNHLAIIF